MNTFLTIIGILIFVLLVYISIRISQLVNSTVKTLRRIRNVANNVEIITDKVIEEQKTIDSMLKVGKKTVNNINAVNENIIKPAVNLSRITQGLGKTLSKLNQKSNSRKKHDA